MKKVLTIISINKVTDMKRYAFYMLVMAVAAVAACQKESAVYNAQEPAQKTYTYTVKASIDDVKSDYAADGKFSWSAGDAISVLFHNGDVNKFFTLTTTADGTASASFTGEIETGYVIGASNTSKIWAFYPASDNHAYTVGANDNRPYFYTPSVIDLSGGKFSANIPMYDVLDAEGNFTFKNMTCAYKFTIQNLDVSKIQVDIENGVSYGLSGLTTMSSNYLRYSDPTPEQKKISYICDVTAKTAVFYVSCRWSSTSFKPTITIRDYSTGYIIKTLTASKGTALGCGEVKRLTISAPGMGSPFVSTLGIDWYGSDASIVSVDGDAAGVKVIKAKADAEYLYIMFGVKKSLLLYREASYPRSNNIQLYFNSSSPGHFCYLYRNGVAQINDASASALSASQIVELEKDDSVFCELKVPRTYSSEISATGSAGVKVCVFYDFWVDNEWGEHSDWGKYVYSPEVTVTLP